MAARSSLALLAVAASLAAGPSRAMENLAPYQLVRSLQLVQDQIANGDHAALPMQQRILRMIDQRLNGSAPEDFADGRNFRALMLYAMSGGNPRTVEQLVSHLVLDEKDAKLSAGLIQYVRGNPGGAIAALTGLEPPDVSAELSPFLALVKGTVLAGKEPQKSLSLLDMARLLGPGTLVEEASLRRTMVLATQLRQPERFVAAAEQYVRRFLRSPYASQFADGFVAGVVSLHTAIDLAAVAEVMAGMTAEQSKVIYLRIARQAAIDRTQGLLDFASRGLEAGASGSDADPRTELYRALADVASAEPGAVRARLAGIDRRKLSASDRLLLDAAAAIVSDVVRPVAAAVPAGPPPLPEPLPDAEAASPRAEAGDPVDYAEPPLNEPDAPADLPPVAAAPRQPAGPDDPALAEERAYVARTRDRLADIDRMLQETTQ